jgi:ferrous-iron efflux pump FieF
MTKKGSGHPIKHGVGVMDAASETISPDSGARLRRLAATASLGLASLLALMKLAAALTTDSVAILSSLIDSLADIVASAITFVSVRISQQPPDRSHRFGHGKAESLSALAQAALVAGSALFVLLDAIRHLRYPDPLSSTGTGIAVMAFATVATLLLVAFQRHVIKQTGSHAISADSLHYRADLLTNLSIIASLVLVQRSGWLWVDPVIGAVIALYLGWHAYGIGSKAVHVLMDHELPAATRERIKEIVLSHHEVHGLHDLRTRESGNVMFIELHLELDGAMTVREAHEVADAVEAELFAAFPNAEVILHQEPAGVKDVRLDHRIAAALHHLG